MNVFHVAVSAQFDANHKQISDLKPVFNRSYRRTLVGIFFDEKRLFQLQIGFMRSNLTHVFKILPVNCTPGDTGIFFNELDIAHLRLHF